MQSIWDPVLGPRDLVLGPRSPLGPPSPRGEATRRSH